MLRDVLLCVAVCRIVPEFGGEAEAVERVDVFHVLTARIGDDVPDSAVGRRQVVRTDARVRHLAAVKSTAAAGAETMRQRRVGRLVVKRGGREAGAGRQRRRETRRRRDVVLAARVVDGRGRRTGVAAALDGAPEARRAVERQRVVDDVVAVVLAIRVDRADDGHAAGRRRAGAGRRASSAAAAPHELRARAGHAHVDAARARPGRRVLRRVAVHGQVAAAARRRRHLRRRNGRSRLPRRLDDAAVRRLARRPADAEQVRAGGALRDVAGRRTLLSSDVRRTLDVVGVELRGVS